MLWKLAIIYIICGLINTIIVILKDPEIVHGREKIIIISSFLFFPLFICFYLIIGTYIMLKFISPAIWWVLDKIADHGDKEDFGEKMEENDNIGGDIYVRDDEEDESKTCDIDSCQSHCPCFRDVGK